MIADVDPDASGTIDFDEFLQMMRDKYAELGRLARAPGAPDVPLGRADVPLARADVRAWAERRGLAAVCARLLRGRICGCAAMPGGQTQRRELDGDGLGERLHRLSGRHILLCRLGRGAAVCSRHVQR